MTQELMVKNRLAEVVHIVVMALSYSSPLWLYWKLIILGIILYEVQLLIFGGCVLTYAQFGTYKASFTIYYLDKIGARFGFQLSHKKAQFVLDYVIPIGYVLLAVISQLVFHFQPILHIL